MWLRRLGCWLHLALSRAHMHVQHNWLWCQGRKCFVPLHPTISYSCFHTAPPCMAQITPGTGLSWGGCIKGMLWALSPRHCTICHVQRSGEICSILSVEYSSIIKDSRMNGRDCNIACQKDICGWCFPVLWKNSCSGDFVPGFILIYRIAFSTFRRAGTHCLLWGSVGPVPSLVGFSCCHLNKHKIPVCSQIFLWLG